MAYTPPRTDAIEAEGNPQGTPLPRVPADLAARGIGLRLEQSDDGLFQRDLYILGRWPEMVTSGWPEQVIISFLAQQSAFQQQHYRAYYADAAWGVITRDGVSGGRLYLQQGAQDIRIIDILLHPALQGQGIGSGIIRAVFDQARAAGLSVSLSVEDHNHGARRLYERLGFAYQGLHGIHHTLTWTPS